LPEKVTAAAPPGSAPAAAPNPILHGTDLTRLVFGLAGPVFVSRFLHTLFHLANVAWVGHLGPAAIGAVTTSLYLFWTYHSLAELLAIGATSLVARHVGAGDRSTAASTAGQAIFAAGVLGIGLLVAGLLGAAPLFQLITDDAEVRRAGASYIGIVSLAAPATCLLFAAEAVFRANGDTKTPMRILLATLALNIVFDPVLILGLGPFPRLGVTGAAIVTTAAQWLGAAIYLVLFLRGRAPFSVRALFAGFRPRWPVIRSLAAIGAPITVIGILFSVVYLGLAKIAAGYGTPILAALGIVNRLEGFAFLTADGFGVAATTLVGQNVGAKQLDRADRLARRARTWSVLLTLAYGIVFLLVPEPILRLFTDDPTVIEKGALFLRIVALAQPFQGAELALEGALAGAGDTRPAMFIAVPLSVVRIPIILWLAGPMGMGPVALWWTLTVTAILRGALLEAWFRTGRWRRRHEALPAG
jgi:putative MATE family efflux protein